MIHRMNLVISAFTKVLDGSKTIELRLNDEKRQRIRGGDFIVFSCPTINDIIIAQVKQLHIFNDFEELYRALPLEKCGYSKAELDTAHFTDMEQYYSVEQIKKYGNVNKSAVEKHTKFQDRIFLDFRKSEAEEPPPQAACPLRVVGEMLKCRC